jgi:monoamine oxidase
MHLYTPYRHVNLSVDYWDARSDVLNEQAIKAGKPLDRVIPELNTEIVFELFKFPGQLLNAERSQQPRKVCVVGGGIAGLTAAYELVVRGYHVVVLESLKRLGGRIWTHRFDRDLYGELGAMRIPDSHGCVKHYVDKFALGTRTFVNNNGNAHLLLRNHSSRLIRNDEWREFLRLYELDPKVDGQRILGHPQQVAGKLVEDLSNSSLTYRDYSSIFQDFKIPETIQLLEQMSVAQLVRGVPELIKRVRLRNAAFEYLGRATGMIWFERTSFLQFVLNELPLKWPKKYEIIGGMDKLIDAFKNHIQRAKEVNQTVEIKTEAQATKLRQLNTGGVEVTWKANGKITKDDFDFVICAAPAAATARIEFDPPLPPAKYEALTNLTYASAAKTIIRCKERFWEQQPDSIFGGGSYTDLANQQCWYPSDNAKAKGDELPDYGSERAEAQVTDWQARDEQASKLPGVFLAAYMWEGNAKRFASLDKNGRTELILNSVQRIHPQLRSYIDDINRDVEHVAWDTEASPGGGAWASFGPGEQHRYQGVLCEPVFFDSSKRPRVFFAGEHLTIIHAWIQSAVQSALCAVIDVINSRT